MEYLLNESKWENAQNMSSLTHMGALIGRKRQRSVSATGYIVVSHNDIEGVNRLGNYGSYFFSLDQQSDYDELVKNESASIVEKHALVPWTYTDCYTIPKGTVFVSNNGVEFFATTSVRSRQLREPFSTIKRSEEKLADFISAGGWDGIKYVKVPVMQGIQKSVTLGRSTGSRLEAFELDASDVEDASNSISEKQFSITTTSATGIEETWLEIANIRLAGPYDQVFEATLNSTGTSMIIKFGDVISGLIPAKDSLITCNYVSTRGTRGNVSTKYAIKKIQWPPGYIQVDPRTNLQDQFLTCSNVVPIQGGRDMEKEEDYKQNAPSSYLKSYSIATIESYEKAILKYSPVNILKMRVFPKTSTVQTDLFKDVADADNLMLRLTTSQSSLGITAITHDGQKIESAQTAFIEPLVQSMGDLKGPTDYLEYVEPNFVQMAAQVTVKSSDLEVPDIDIKNYVKAAILDEYSVQNTDFGKPFYYSSVMERSSSFAFCNAVNIQLEAIATTKYDEPLMLATGDMKDQFATSVFDSYVCVPFQFDEVFGFTKNKAGFANYKQSSPFLLRVEIRMPNLTTSRDRTLLVYDSRLSGTETTFEDAKDMVLPGKPLQTTKLSVLQASKDFIKLYDERSENFRDRQVRIAQFPFFENVCSDSNMFSIQSFEYSPYEIRPLVITQTGTNKEFSTNTVEQTLREPLVSGATVGQKCYKRDINYYEGFDVIFYENYERAGTQDFAHGYVVIPREYLGFGASLANIGDQTSAMDVLPVLLKDNVSIKVFARPLITDIELDDKEDIVFIDQDDIRVEKIGLLTN
jgi:hypothetical protein